MIPARANRLQLAVVLLLLVALHFYVRPRLWGPRVSPDFLLVGLMLFAMRSGPGASAVAGFLVGLAADSLTPATSWSTPPSWLPESGCGTSWCLQ